MTIVFFCHCTSDLKEHGFDTKKLQSVSSFLKPFREAACVSEASITLSHLGQIHKNIPAFQHPAMKRPAIETVLPAPISESDSCMIGKYSLTWNNGQG